MEEGRKQLAISAGFRRLITVALHRGQQYEGMDSIQAELSARVMELAPAGMPAQQQVTAPAAAFTGLWGSHLSSWEGVGMGSVTLVCSWRACQQPLLNGQKSRSQAVVTPVETTGASASGGPSGSTETVRGKCCPPCRLRLSLCGSLRPFVCFPTFARGVLGHFASWNHRYLRVGWERAETVA